jgi:polar amino acid transport system substrate-binding protein
MRHTIPAAFVAIMLAAGCGDPLAEVRKEIAPAESIRAALNFGNPVLATKQTPDGAAGGIAVELVRELGARLGLPVQLVSYDSAAAMADDARTGGWDVAFLAADPAREETIVFTPPYLELEATYLVAAGSRFQTLGDVDADGVRIAARPRSAYDLFLRRSLARAELVYPEGEETDLGLLTSGRVDALAGLRHVLVDNAADVPGLRLLDGRFAAMQQAIGVPRGRDATVAFLREFVEDVKASGLVARAIEASRAQGVAVAR